MKHVVGITISNEKIIEKVSKQKQQDSISHYASVLECEFYGILDITMEYSNKDLKKLLELLKQQDVNSILIDANRFPKGLLKEMDRLINYMSMELIKIYHEIYLDRNCLFIKINKSVSCDFEFLNDHMLNKRITDIYVLYENDICITQSMDRCRPVIDALNIRFHEFKSIERK